MICREEIKCVLIKFVGNEYLGQVTRRMGCYALFGRWPLKYYAQQCGQVRSYTHNWLLFLVLSDKRLSWEAGFLGTAKSVIVGKQLCMNPRAVEWPKELMRSLVIPVGILSRSRETVLCLCLVLLQNKVLFPSVHSNMLKIQKRFNEKY